MGFALEPGQYHPLPQVVLTRPALPQTSDAPTARYIKAQGKREARRPGFTTSTRDRGLKGRNTQGITPFQGWNVLIVRYQGRRASRLPLALIFRAVGAPFGLLRQSYLPQ